MAFVAFATKKVNSAQQQQGQQGQLSRSDEQCSATTASYQQQQNLVVTQSIAQTDLEGFRMADAEADPRSRDGLGFDPLFCDEPPADASKEQLSEADDGGGGISQLIEHNNALRRNFDNLKHLHLQLAEANAQLQEAFLNMQAEKARVEGGIMHHSAIQREKEVLEAELEEMKSRHAKEMSKLRAEREEISGLALELGQKNMSLEKKVALMKGNNEDLSQMLEVVRYGHDVDRSLSTEVLRLEKDDAVTAKHAAELHNARNLALVKVEDQNYRQQAADLAHKCKHLEIDLEKAITAGEAVHQQLVALTYEKDAIITDLEQALRRLREEHKLKDSMQQEAYLKLKESSYEIGELRNLLSALEKSKAATESQHSKEITEVQKECETLRKDLGTALAAQKEAADRLVDVERLRDRKVIVQSFASFCQKAKYRKSKEELERTIESMKLEIAEAIAVREKEQATNKSQLEDMQRKWEEEKSALQKREDFVVKAIKQKCRCKYTVLKKTFKRTSKLLATMTVAHNQLTIRMRECEAQLAIAQRTRRIGRPLLGLQVITAAGSGWVDASSLRRTTPGVNACRSGYFESEMKELSDRQAKFSVGT
ncbi:hypothetical protein Mp_1g20250 [Marchantia polymorpha subsp. ruderalis]|uniref:Uncharacterized protein n=2 Tax=Marchantia polymorpha TaxID=3197 RepID=A0AAF6AS74_MARPO|nr:hypothetical protein MARPO_0001s0362 [Marchantia polymorpha]BBM99294.1 hypothetical protein Mp_1g20250 [Marchantia polymorpha subsp. ruderalis]|eukprot:PTQ50376.1 hypothetical protein MARPO_0001s0362 [Marchantia polymorpha]